MNWTNTKNDNLEMEFIAVFVAFAIIISFIKAIDENKNFK